MSVSFNFVFLMSNSAAGHSIWSLSGKSAPARALKYKKEFCRVVFEISCCKESKASSGNTMLFLQQSRFLLTCSGHQEEVLCTFQPFKLQLKNICINQLHLLCPEAVLLAGAEKTQVLRQELHDEMKGTLAFLHYERASSQETDQIVSRAHLVMSKPC